MLNCLCPFRVLLSELCCCARRLEKEYTTIKTKEMEEQVEIKVGGPVWAVVRILSISEGRDLTCPLPRTTSTLLGENKNGTSVEKK